MMFVKLMNLLHIDRGQIKTQPYGIFHMTRPSISFEFFPPKSLQASFRLWECVKTLAPMDPAFVSVTYGAGDTTNQLTHDTVDAIVKSSDLQVAAHLTCIDATRHETLAIATDYNSSGVNHIVALRGDPPKGW